MALLMYHLLLHFVLTFFFSVAVLIKKQVDNRLNLNTPADLDCFNSKKGRKKGATATAL